MFYMLKHNLPGSNPSKITSWGYIWHEDVIWLVREGQRWCTSPEGIMLMALCWWPGVMIVTTCGIYHKKPHLTILFFFYVLLSSFFVERSCPLVAGTPVCGVEDDRGKVVVRWSFSRDEYTLRLKRNSFTI